ncbi:MAG: hypothetical protein ACLFPS_00640 [Clostridia bacterium]
MSKIEKNKKVIRNMKLPYPGEVYVEEGQEVTPETLIAKTELLDIQPGYFDVSDFFNEDFSIKDFKEILNVKIGDYVSRGDVLAEHDSQKLEAPYYGYIEHISESGQYILIRQKVSEDEEPLVIDTAEELGISSRSVTRILQVEVGEEVFRSQALAGDIKIVYTPMSGVIKDINQDGKITIKPFYRPKMLYANVYGTVEKTDEKQAVSILTTVDLIQGMIGVGKEHSGKLVKLENANENDIAFKTGKITKNEIRNAIDKDVSGVIASSADADDLLDIFGSELYSGVTGIEEKPISLILTDGFGNTEMQEEIVNGLENSLGENVTIIPKTNLQTPVRYPEIYLYKN